MTLPLSSVPPSIRRQIVQQGDCWVWTGRLSYGYPVAGTGGIAVRRVLFEMAGYYVKPSELVHQDCETALCVHPDHAHAGPRLDHGYSRYANHGCRCDVCREGRRAYESRRRASE